jgi:hypothetical protein
MVLTALGEGGAGARPVRAADVGRFITEDPAEDGINWYVHTRNNPATYADSTGLENRRERWVRCRIPLGVVRWPRGPTPPGAR